MYVFHIPEEDDVCVGPWTLVVEPFLCHTTYFVIVVVGIVTSRFLNQCKEATIKQRSFLEMTVDDLDAILSAY